MFTVLYHWRLLPGRTEAFCDAWSRGTRLIHRSCGSYGARLHLAGDHAWSYARWPSAEARRDCFTRSDVAEDPSFPEMQACVAEHFDEIVLDIVDDQLDEPSAVHPPVSLTTERLALRPLRIEDALVLHDALCDPAVMRYWSRPAHTTMEESLATIRRNVSHGGQQSVAMTRREDPETALGWVVLIDRRPDVVELGYFLHPRAHGQGFAREAAGAMVEHAFANRGVRRVYADTDPDNVASIRLLRRLGFTEEGRLRAQWETHLGVRDALIFGRLATDGG